MIRARVLAVAAAAVAMLGGCQLAADPPAPPVSTAGTSPSVSPSLPPASPPPVSGRPLDQLAIAPESSADYDRDAYGEPWADVDGNGCNQRDDRLLMDAVPGTAVVAPQGNCPHDVLAGQWIDPYTGLLLTATDLKDQMQAQSVTIDHIVPLAEAHDSGAASWPAEQRIAFANDLDALRVVAGDVNSAKSDGDPAEWLPPAPAAVCGYVTVWIAVKIRWQLTVDPAEHAALAQLDASCGDTSTSLQLAGGSWWPAAGGGVTSSPRGWGLPAPRSRRGGSPS